MASMYKLPRGTVVQNLPANPEMQEMRVQSLDREDPLEQEMATPVFMLRKCHGQRSLMGYSSWGCKESDMSQQLSVRAHTHTHRDTHTNVYKMSIMSSLDIRDEGSRECWNTVAKSCPTLLRPHILQPTRVLCPWNFSGKNTRARCYFLLQVTFLIQGLKPHPCVCFIGQWILYHCPTLEVPGMKERKNQREILRFGMDTFMILMCWVYQN